MKKIVGVLSLCMVVLLIAGVFVTATNVDMVDEIKEVVEQVSTGEVGEEVFQYIETFVSKKNINPEEINDISKVDFEDLPKEVNIENVGDTNLAIYEVAYDDPSEQVEKKVFVVTYSVEELKAQGDLIIAHDKRQFLNFGFAGEMESSGFLETATGVEASLEKGYVMMRAGSITGLSTNLEVVEGGEGQIEIIIYKNGERIGFGNGLNAYVGVGADYDIQSNGVVTFESGDVISVYVDASEGIVWEDVITMIEITTTN